jgi:hypothetical protein
MQKTIRKSVPVPVPVVAEGVATNVPALQFPADISPMNFISDFGINDAGIMLRNLLPEIF